MTQRTPQAHRQPYPQPQPQPQSQPQPQPQPQNELGEEDEELQRALEASMKGIENPGSVAASKESNEASDVVKEEQLIKKPCYPLLSEEPKGDMNLLCRVAIAFLMDAAFKGISYEQTQLNCYGPSVLLSSRKPSQGHLNSLKLSQEYSY